jgi:hypothetical protein
MTFETFWPPSKDELRALRRRLAAFFVVPLAIVFAVLVPVIAFTQWRGSFDLHHQLEWSVPVSATAFVVLGALALVLPRVQVRTLRGVIANAPELPQLEPGERLLVLCLGFFLDKRYRLGFLAVTDRRLLRVEGTNKGSRQAVLCTRDDLASSELTVRRATRNPLWSFILHSMKTEHGLWFTTRSGQSYFFASDHFFVEPLQAWLERAGVTTGFRNDADVKERPEVSAVSFTETPIASVRRRTRRAWAVVATILLLSIGVQVGVFVWSQRRHAALLASIPNVVPVSGALPALSRTRHATKKGVMWTDVEGSDPWPSGPETVVRQFWVMASRPGKTNQTAEFELVRIGPDAIVRRGGFGPLPDATYSLEWERMGSSSDGDDDLERAAIARFKFLAGATIDLDADTALPEIATRRDLGDRLESICRIVVNHPTGPRASEVAFFDLLRDGEKALLKSALYVGNKQIPCEEVGDASASDDALLQAAIARLRALATKPAK